MFHIIVFLDKCNAFKLEKITERFSIGQIIFSGKFINTCNCKTNLFFCSSIQYLRSVLSVSHNIILRFNIFLYKHVLKHKFLQILQLITLTLVKGDEVVNILKIFSYLLLLFRIYSYRNIRFTKLIFINFLRYCRQ